MAKLHSYYGLCPIIDQYSLLGIAEDCEKGHAIVTLDKNIAIKYRVADQKQINSWRTKDKYSSPVLYDWHTEKYVAAFNQSYLRMWNTDEEQVDKQKKFKFNNGIHTLLSYLQETFIIFKNGLICKLDMALEHRKSMDSDGIVKNDGYISDVLYTNVKSDIYIGLIIINDNTKDFYWTRFTDNCLSEFSNFELKCAELNLVGYMLNKPNIHEDVALVTIWSNGKLHVQSLYKEIDPPGLQYALIESLSPEFCITMLPLDQDYIAMYGADKNGEGATLIIYNMQFKLVQSRQMFKMFKNQAHIWRIDNNLLLCVGQNLAVVPFQLETEQLAALVGSHKMVTLDKDQDLILHQEVQTDLWDENISIHKNKHIPYALEPRILEMIQQGHTDATICDILVPEMIAANDVRAIKSSLTFFSDIPDNCMAAILKFILNVNELQFKTTRNDKSTILKPFERKVMINMILQLPFNSLHLMPYIRKELSEADVILLLKYIMYMLSDNDEPLTLNFEKQLVNWSCFLLDANYQKFMLARNDSVTAFLITFDKFINEYLTKLEQIDKAVPYLNLNRKNKNDSKQASYTNYSIEDITLF